MLHLTFKVSGGSNFEMDVPETSTVGDVKGLCVEQSKIDKDQQKIIFKGRILKDEETLAQHGVQAGNILHLVKGAKAGQPTDTPATTTTAPAAVPAAVPAPAANPANAFGNMMNDPAMMQQAMGQMPNMANMGGAGMDPAMMSTLMQSPVFSQMLETMSQNPQFMAQMLQSNPQVQQMAASNPQMAMLLQNPQLLASLMNPQTMNAMMQLQALQGGGQPAAQAAQPAMPAGQAGQYNEMMAAMQNNPMFAQMMSSGSSLPPAAMAEFETRYASEIAQLEGMGFMDRAGNIEALRVCDGNVELAINYLFDLGAGPQ